MSCKTESASFVPFEWSRVANPKFEGRFDLISVELDGRRVTFSTRIGEDLENVRTFRPLQWTYDGAPAEIRTTAIGPFHARFDISLGGRSLTLTSRALGFDVLAGPVLEARQRRSHLRHRSDTSSEVLAACLAVSAFRLDRGLTMQSNMIDGLELLGRRPGVFAEQG